MIDLIKLHILYQKAIGEINLEIRIFSLIRYKVKATQFSLLLILH